jgi:hypothetical protein
MPRLAAVSPTRSTLPYWPCLPKRATCNRPPASASGTSSRCGNCAHAWAQATRRRSCVSSTPSRPRSCVRASPGRDSGSARPRRRADARALARRGRRAARRGHEAESRRDPSDRSIEYSAPRRGSANRDVAYRARRPTRATKRTPRGAGRGLARLIFSESVLDSFREYRHLQIMPSFATVY